MNREENIFMKLKIGNQTEFEFHFLFYFCKRTKSKLCGCQFLKNIAFNPHLVMFRFAPQTQHYSDNKRWSDLDLRIFDIIHLMSGSTEEHVQNLKDMNYLVVLTIDSVSKEHVILHHLTQISGAIQIPETNIVALNVFGSQSSAVLVPPAMTFLTAQLKNKSQIQR